LEFRLQAVRVKRRVLPPEGGTPNCGVKPRRLQFLIAARGKSGFHPA